ncbi:unnamed protein product [Trichogramma brassicae]|uniref:Uncharacterized protein n=1 Tax=Trichogramma brassicae TaxID=86971 RepID=A0A6H5I9C4_9HYME|nr:unnamed protein product [Trichogramma brassicae]
MSCQWLFTQCNASGSSCCCFCNCRYCRRSSCRCNASASSRCSGGRDPTYSQTAISG